MYVRGVGADGKMKLTDSDPMNPALGRARTDDLVTIPDDWADSSRFSQRKRLYKAMHVTGSNISDLKKTKGDPTGTPTLVGSSAAAPPWNEVEWKNIIANATKWCKQNKVRLVFACS